MRPQHTCEQDPGSDEQTVVAQFGRTHGSKRATRCHAAHRCARCGWAGESSWSTTCCYALCAPAAPPRPSHISRSSAPGLAHICAGTRAHLRRDSRTSARGPGPGPALRKQGVANTLRRVATRCTVLQHGVLLDVPRPAGRLSPRSQCLRRTRARVGSAAGGRRGVYTPRCTRATEWGGWGGIACSGTDGAMCSILCPPMMSNGLRA